MIKAVLFDFGGVLTTSPFEAFDRYERENDYPRGFIRRINATNPDHNAWARLERAEIGMQEFDRLFDAEATAAGRSLPGRHVLELLAGDLRADMVQALRICHQRFRTACLTNNFVRGTAAGASTPIPPRHGTEVLSLFHVIVESSRLGIRKPQPEFYKHALSEVGVTAGEAVFLDDLGVNLKPARELGMQTIKVVTSEQAITELEAVLGLDLRAA
jgi:putative hydrolase of the HAD superfamily